MRRFLFITLLLNVITIYSQNTGGFSQSRIWGDLAISKRTTLYTAKVAATATSDEKVRVAKMEKELREADFVFFQGEFSKALSIYMKYEDFLDGEQCFYLAVIYYRGKSVERFRSDFLLVKKSS